MKKIVVLGVLLVAFASCTIREKMHLKADGTGSFTTVVDMSAMMERMGQQMASDDGPVSEREEMTFKEFFEEKQDSISKLPKEEQAALKALENMKMTMVMDSEAKVFDLAIGLDFKSLKELTNVNEKISKAQMVAASQSEEGAKAAANPMLSGLGDNKTNVAYTMTNNTFVRKTEILKDAEPDENAAMLKDMLVGSKYIQEYTFEKAIQSVNVKNAIISEDKKSVIIEHTLQDSMDNPKALDLEIVFED
jgi:hypothetical protein